MDPVIACMDETTLVKSADRVCGSAPRINDCAFCIEAGRSDMGRRRDPRLEPRLHQHAQRIRIASTEGKTGYRYELGAEVYGSMGISIAGTARHAAAVMRNFDFFGTPLAGIASGPRSGRF